MEIGAAYDVFSRIPESLQARENEKRPRICDLADGYSSCRDAIRSVDPDKF